MDRVDLAAMVPSWQISLEAEQKARPTIDGYLLGVRLFIRWCEDQGHDAVLERQHVRAFIASLMASGQAPATGRSRLTALKRFSAWLAEEGEITADELKGLPPPKLSTTVVDPLTTEECVRMLKVCEGKSFVDRRDDAILRLMLETGSRARETLGLTVDDIDLARGLAIIRKGKGGKARVLPFSPQVARALDRYIRMRAKHPKAHRDDLWLGGTNQTFSYWGLDRALKRRAEMAGVDGFHLHRTRHTAATRWLAAGGSEGGLMAVAGWSNRAMLDRYTRASAADRAAAEARRLDLGSFM